MDRRVQLLRNILFFTRGGVHLPAHALRGRRVPSQNNHFKCLRAGIKPAPTSILNYSTTYNLNHMKSSAKTISPEYCLRQAATTSISSQRG